METEEAVSKIIESIWSRYKSDNYKKEVLEFGTKQAYEIDLKHIESTFEWVKTLFPGCPAALRVAAIGHDIDRAWPQEMVKLDRSRKGRMGDEEFRLFKLAHARNSFEMLMKYHFLGEVSAEFQVDVRFLVYNHETGGLRNSEGQMLKIQDFSSESYDLNMAAQTLTDSNQLATLTDNLPAYLVYQGEEITKKKILSFWSYISKGVRDRLISGEIGLDSEIRRLVDEIGGTRKST